MTVREVGAVVFDTDGTLVDPLPVVLLCYRRAVVDEGGADLSAEAILAAWGVPGGAR